MGDKLLLQLMINLKNSVITLLIFSQLLELTYINCTTVGHF